MHRVLVPVYLVAACFVGGLVLYAYTEMSKVAALIHPDQDAVEEAPPLTLEEAAPEAVAHREGFRMLVAKSKFVAGTGPQRDRSDFPTVHGKAIVWDAKTNDISDVQGLLPADVRAPNPDGPVVVFLITEQERRLENTYTYDIFARGGPTPIVGYLTISQVSVIEMPSMQALGRYRLYGNEAPSGTYVKRGPTDIEGGWKGPMSCWVESFIRGPEWREKQAQPKIAAGHEGYAQLAMQAKAVLPKCQAKGAHSPIPPLPARGFIWIAKPEHPYRVNCMAAAQQHVAPERQAGPDEQEVVVFLLLEEKFIAPMGNVRLEDQVARWDQTVAVVAMPGSNPIGVYTIRGETYHTNVKGKHNNGPDVQEALGRWVTRYLESPQSVLRQ